MARFLGKLDPVADPRRLRFASLLAPQLAAAPGSCDLTCGIRDWGMMLNEREGDCTVAARGHLIMEMSAATTQHPIVVPDSEIQAAYCAVCPTFDPATGAGDNGALCTDVLEYSRTVGIGGYKIDGWAAIDLSNGQHVAQAVYYLGGAYIGIQLPSSAEQQTNAGQAWTVPWFATIVGGHCIPIVAYDANGLWCVTWGRLQYMTWDFFFKYCDEAYALQDKLWINASNRIPPGFDASVVPTALAAVAA
ncbi:MAG: hypothetical protein ACYDCI_00045 [Candidatus Limnocylindrales bacterium]